SGGGLLRATTVVPASALRAAGPRRDGAKTRRATEHRTQDHARGPALRPDLSSWFETGRGGGVLFVHVANGHGCAGDRYRLSTQRVGGFGSIDLSTWRIAAGIALFRAGRQGRHNSEKPQRSGSPDGLSLSRSDFVEKLPRRARLSARETIGARRLSSERSRPRRRGWRPGSQ